MAEVAYAVQRKTHELWHDERRPLFGALDIELTERCNNDCIHCCINRSAGDAECRAREMNTEEVQRILAEAAELGCLRVRFTGGEPLLRPDFETLYLYARRLGMKVLLFTNARLITLRLADLFVRIPPRAPLEITVYGMSPASYEAVTRAPGSYAQFRHGVDLLLERHVPFIVKGALLPPNRHEIAVFQAWAATVPGMANPPSYSMRFDLRCRRDDPGKNRLIEGLRVDLEGNLAVVAKDRTAYLAEMRRFCAQFMGPAGDRLFACGFAEDGCVDAYGRFQPCMGIRAPDLTYDLRASSAASAAQAAGDVPAGPPTLHDAIGRFFPLLRELRATNLEYLQHCARCFLKGLCEQCPAKSWAEHGTLDTPVAYLCTMAHAQARDLGLLSDGEMGWDVTAWQERISRLAVGTQAS